MARMIPASLDHSKKEIVWGERKVFDALKGDDETKDWVVLHSLDIANHPDKFDAEADFVVLAPGYGYLFLEVKGAKKVRRDEETGYWYYGNNPKPDTESPFTQASGALYSIIDTVKNQDYDLVNKPLYSHAVVFPFVDVDIQTNEWKDWQNIGKRIFAGGSFGKTLKKVFMRLREEAGSKQTWKNKDGSIAPTREQVDKVAKILKPGIAAEEAPKERKKRIYEELAHYTNLQNEALNQLADNDQVIFQGPAGSGKTTLALEAARRAGEEGKSVLLLCYNKLLGRWLENQVSDYKGNVQATNLHRFMAQIVDTPSRNVSKPVYFEEELPKQAIETIIDTENDGMFDLLILDEAQDFVHDIYFEFFEWIVKPNLLNAQAYFFGDFTDQAIFGDSFREIIKDRNLKPVAFRLEENLRNTPEIVHSLGKPNLYKAVKRDSNGKKPRPFFYKDQHEQQELLIKELEHLHEDGFKPSDICILSPLQKKSAANQLVGKGLAPWKDNIRHADDEADNLTRYASIGEFKGLESLAVIVTDIDNLDDIRQDDLLYIARTRALDSLSILVDKKEQISFVNKYITQE